MSKLNQCQIWNYNVKIDIMSKLNYNVKIELMSKLKAMEPQVKNYFIEKLGTLKNYSACVGHLVQIKRDFHIFVIYDKIVLEERHNILLDKLKLID